jgi:hypothetical protein
LRVDQALAAGRPITPERLVLAFERARHVVLAGLALAYLKCTSGFMGWPTRAEV